MATTTAKAARRAHARKRIADATAVLAERFGVDIPASGGHIRDADLATIVDGERQADLLEAVIAATKPKAGPKKPGLKDDAA